MKNYLYRQGYLKGLAGEDSVYSVLSQLTNSVSSQFYNANLFRNVELPSFTPDWRGGLLRSSEADFVLLTKAAAYSVEVKHRSVFAYVNSAVTVAELFDCEGNCLDCDPIAQNNIHTQALSRLLKIYPKDRVFGVTVFVEPLLLEGNAHEFKCGRLVTDLEHLPALMEQKEQSLRPYLSNEWLLPAIDTLKVREAFVIGKKAWESNEEAA